MLMNDPLHVWNDETSFTVRGATGVTLQPHQILRLPRKMTLMIDPSHIWNVIYNARSNTEQQASPSNLTKYCASTQNCNPTSKRNLPKTVEASLTMRGLFDHDPNMKLQNWTRPFAKGHAFGIENYYNMSRSGYLSKFHRILRLPRNATATSPSIVPATKSDTATAPNIPPATYFTELTFLSCYFTELLLYWAVTLLSCFSTELLLYWAVTLLSCHFTEFLLYWTVTLLNCYFRDSLICYFAELLLSQAVTLLSCFFTELLLYWTVTSEIHWTVTLLRLSCYFTELLLYWAVTWRSCYFTDPLLYWAVTLRSFYFTELLFHWAVTFPSCYFTELLLYRPVTLVSCYFTEVLLYWAVTSLFYLAVTLLNSLHFQFFVIRKFLTSTSFGFRKPMSKIKEPNSCPARLPGVGKIEPRVMQKVPAASSSSWMSWIFTTGMMCCLAPRQGPPVCPARRFWMCGCSVDRWRRLVDGRCCMCR